MGKVLFVLTVLGASTLAGFNPATAQGKSCFDQWYELRTKEMQGSIPRRGIQPSAASRDDIATCEASKDKKFKRIKSLREAG